MGEIDRQYLEASFYGSKRMKAWLERSGIRVSRKRVQRLMRAMRLRAIYRRPSTGRRSPESPVYPYLLRNVRITRPNQVWAADITYLPMARGFLYLVAVMDWHSRYKVDAEHPARMSDPLGCCCNIGEMARKVPVKCAIAGCHYQRKMTLAERAELRRVGRENNATPGLSAPST